VSKLSTSARRLVLLFALLVIPVSVGAQFLKLDDAGSRLAKQLKPLKPKLVAVADFSSADDSVARPISHYFAWFLSESMRQHGGRHLQVSDHREFDADLAKVQIFPTGPASVQSLGNASAHVGATTVRADIVVIGAAVKHGATYELDITAVQVSSAASLSSIHVSMSLSEFLESLITPFPAAKVGPLQIATSKGVSVPSCVRCPDPIYNELARASHIQGTSVFEVVVDEQGRVEQIHPVKLLGYGLDESAYNAIKKWQLKPARDRNGDPIKVRVPIEVTFHLF